MKVDTRGTRRAELLVYRKVDLKAAMTAEQTAPWMVEQWVVSTVDSWVIWKAVWMAAL